LFAVVARHVQFVLADTLIINAYFDVIADHVQPRAAADGETTRIRANQKNSVPAKLIASSETKSSESLQVETGSSTVGAKNSRHEVRVIGPPIKLARSSVEQERERVEEELNTVKAEIKQVESDIKKVESQVEAVEARLEGLDPSSGMFDRYYALLCDKEKQLRDKEKQLREEKKQLRDEKTRLHDKEAQLVFGTMNMPAKKRRVDGIVLSFFSLYFEVLRC
jgi:chromosome segregation ATPase